MTSPVSSKEEYDVLVSFLSGEDSNVEGDKHSKYRLKKKSEDFILIDKTLYLKDDKENHKRVFYQGQSKTVKLEVQTLHNSNHYGQNRLYELCKKMYFSIPRSIAREVCKECNVCAQAQPLKTKEKFKYILDSKPFERLIFDLIDMRTFKEDNDGLCWILTYIDVYSKYMSTFPLKSKSAVEVQSKLQSLFYLLGVPQIIQCDNGKEFKNSILVDYCKENNIALIHDIPRRPQSQVQLKDLTRLSQDIYKSI
jgi:RNase P subunit RPR2